MCNSILTAYNYVYIELNYLKTEAANKMSKFVLHFYIHYKLFTFYEL